MATRRDYGTGAIYKDTNRGGYRGEIRLDGKMYVRRGKTRAEVKDRLNALLRDHTAGTLVRNANLTVAQVVDRYVTRVVPNRKGGRLSPTSLYRYTWAARHIIDEIGTTRAGSLTTRQVENMLDRLAARPLSLDSVKKIQSVLVLSLEKSVADGELPRNVARYATLPADAVRRPQPRKALNMEMTHRLLAGLDSERNGAMYALTLYLCARPGEAAGLYWDDIDLDAGTVNFTRVRQTDARGHASIVDEMKVAHAKRTAVMPEPLVEMLRRHRARQAEERLAATTWADARLVFASTVGSELAATSVRRQLANICGRLGVSITEDGAERPPVPYELRHTGITVLAENREPAESIARLAGTSVVMIEKHYRHWLRPEIHIARDVWASLG